MRSSIEEEIHFKNACKNGNLDIVTQFLKNPTAFVYNEAIIHASQAGYTDIAKLLIKDGRVDSGGRDGWAIVYASYYGFPEIVELLCCIALYAIQLG